MNLKDVKDGQTLWTFDVLDYRLISGGVVGPMHEGETHVLRTEAGIVVVDARDLYPTKDVAARAAFKWATSEYDRLCARAARAFAALPVLACEFETDDAVYTTAADRDCEFRPHPDRLEPAGVAVAGPALHGVRS